VTTVPDLPAGADHPTFRFVFDYWRTKAPDAARLPGRQHIDPLDLGRFLPNLMLIDVERTGADLLFRVRLVGGAITDASGLNMTGQYLNQSGRWPTIAQRMTDLVERKRPYYTIEKVKTPLHEHVVLRRLALPLAADGATVDMILGCCVVQHDDAPFNRARGYVEGASVRRPFLR
jgi:hypothetical protein